LTTAVFSAFHSLQGSRHGVHTAITAACHWARPKLAQSSNGKLLDSRPRGLARDRSPL